MARLCGGSVSGGFGSGRLELEVCGHVDGELEGGRRNLANETVNRGVVWDVVELLAGLLVRLTGGGGMKLKL